MADPGLLGAKIGGIGLLLGCAFVFGVIPFKLTGMLRRSPGSWSAARSALILSCIQCFGGGILWATVFVHMLPAAQQALTSGRPDSNFPLAEVLVCLGTFSIYIIEEVVECFLRQSGRTEYTHSHECDDVTPVMHKNPLDYTSLEGSSSDGGGPRDYGSYGSILDHQGHSHLPGADSRVSSLRVLVVAVALSVHSVFEGMAIGLESRTSNAWLLIGAITIHKSIVAFCIGEQLSTSNQPLKAGLITLSVFVMASPLGIALGMIFVSLGQDLDGSTAFLTGVLQALAAGTILYVVFFEIIQGEREKSGNGLVKLLAIVAGFLVMLMITSLTEQPNKTARPTVAPDHNITSL